MHRPEPSLMRLTPANHDELLFDDMLWVKRAQWEHAQFVACMRERGVKVFYASDLLCDAPAASEDARRLVIEQVADALFTQGSAERVIACCMTKDRAHMHLDTVFTLLDRDKVTIFPKVVHAIRAISLRPGKNRAIFT